MADHCHTGTEWSVHVSGDQACLQHRSLVRHLVLAGGDGSTICSGVSSLAERLLFRLVRIDDMCSVVVLCPIDEGEVNGMYHRIATREKCQHEMVTWHSRK